MKKIIIPLTILCAGISFANAQSDADALRFSETNVNGTARSVAMGNAFGAVGADFSSLSINPAGIGLYRKTEFMFSPDMMFKKTTTSSFLGNNHTNYKFSAGIGNIGLVASGKLRNAERHGWQTINFGIGYNRLNNFNTSNSYSGMNGNNSFLDYVLQQTNTEAGTSPSQLDPFMGNLAYQSYLINPVDTTDTTHYNSVIPHAGELQRRSFYSQGSSGEIVTTLGANYKDRLYLGITLGFVMLNYDETSDYEESDEMDTISDFKSFNLNQKLSTEGKGFNVKLGMIFRATDWLRLGAAFHSPTILNMDDNYTSTMKSEFDDGSTYDNTAKGKYNYFLTTPLKGVASIAFIIAKQAVLSADYELMNYSEMEFSSTGDAFFDVNNSIGSKYTTTGNLHIGAEWKPGNLAFRGGYSMYGSPFKSGMNHPGADFSRNTYSAGIGLRDEKYFLDFAYSLSMTNEFYRPYTLNNQEVEGSINKIQAHNLSVTLGVKF